MPGDEEIVTASQMESMSPNERQRQFDEHLVTELARVPTAFLERARTKGRGLLDALGVVDPIDQ